MKYLSLAIATLAVSSPVFSQVTSPPGYLTTDGEAFAYYFGGYENGHYQQCDGELGTSVLPITSVAFRLDYRSHSTSTAAGRTWSNVTLHLSDGDTATMTNTFASNILSTPVMVFSGSATFPDVTGNPTTNPAPWMPAFPCSTTYIHTGTKDLLLDWQFSNGTLANATTWGTTSLRTYYLDGINATTSVTYGRNVYRNEGNTTTYCADSYATSTTAYAGSSLQVGLYHSSYTPTPAWAGQAVLQIFGSNLAPNSTFFRGIGLGGTTPGVSLKPFFHCYNLMIDISLIQFYVLQTTTSSGSISPWLYLPVGPLSVLSKYGSVPIWSQGAFNDSVTGQAKLATAERCTPNFAYVLSAAPNRKTVYTSNATNTTGSGPYDYYYMNQITRYN